MRVDYMKKNTISFHCEMVREQNICKYIYFEQNLVIIQYRKS